MQSPDKVACDGEPYDGDQADTSPAERTTTRAEDHGAAAAAVDGLVRDRNTWTLYWLLGLVGFLLNGLGARSGR